MERAVAVLYKIEKCYDGDEGYNNRKKFLPLFFEELKQLKDISNSDKVILLFFSNDSWQKRKIIVTELFMNINSYRSFIDINKQFYKDECHESSSERYNIKKYETEDMKKEIQNYLEKLNNDYDLTYTLCIDNEKSTDFSCSDYIVTTGGLEETILTLRDYINSFDAKKKIYKK